MNTERFLTRRKLLLGTMAGAAALGLTAAGAAPIEQVQPQEPERNEGGGCLGPIAVIGTIGFGFWVMTGGLNRRSTPRDREIRDLRRRLDRLERDDRR